MMHFRPGQLFLMLICSIGLCGGGVMAETFQFKMPASLVLPEGGKFAELYDLALLDQLAAFHPEIEQAEQLKEIEYDDLHAGIITSPVEGAGEEKVLLIKSGIPGSWMTVLAMFVLLMIGRVIWRRA